jgi:outer membrane lipoprotein-sorting protein
MNRVEWTRRLVWCGFALLAIASVIGALPRLVRADEETEKKGAALMDKFVDATGGKAAYEAIKSRIVKAEATMPGGGMTGKMEVHAVYPDKFRAAVEMPGGKFERGSDGKTVWISHPSFGAYILEGADRVSAIRESTQDRFGQWRNIYQKAEYVGDEELNGAKCSKVVLTLKPIDPKVKEFPVTVLIAQDSGLIVKWTTEMTTPQGNVEVAVSLEDYRKIGDVLIPHKMTVAAQDLEQSVKIEEIVFNAEIPSDKFALPEAVTEQLKNSKKDDKKPDGKEKE